MSEATQLVITPPDDLHWQPRRVNLPDLEELGIWLVKRLKDRHQEATTPQVMGYLRGVIYSSEHWFVRTPHAVALARVERIPLEPQPLGYEVFVLAQQDYEYEAASLYPPMASWAANLDCSHLILDHYTDVTRSAIRGRLGGIVSKSHAVFRLGRLTDAE